MDDEWVGVCMGGCSGSSSKSLFTFGHMFSACLGDLPSDMPRRPETWFSLCNLMLKLRGILRSSAILGSNSP